MAAYPGHRLSLVATSFAYDVPCPYRSDPFRFRIENIDQRKLAFALHCIIKGHYTGRDEVNIFQDEALMHFSNCLQENITPHVGVCFTSPISIYVPIKIVRKPKHMGLVF
jgi:hypothetical protein